MVVCPLDSFSKTKSVPLGTKAHPHCTVAVVIKMCINIPVVSVLLIFFPAVPSVENPKL